MSENKLLDLSFEFAFAIVNLVDGVTAPKSSYMTDQLARAGTSVGANIHEAQYAQTLDRILQNRKGECKMKNKPLVTGIIAVASPLPLIVFTVLWSLIWFFGIGMGLFSYDTIPQWILICSLLPLFISPTFGLLGIVHGIIKIKLKRAWIGILLSVLGLIENFILIYGMYYIGSRF